MHIGLTLTLVLTSLKKKQVEKNPVCGSELLQREKEKKEKLAIAELVKELMLPLSEQRNIRCNTP